MTKWSVSQNPVIYCFCNLCFLLGYIASVKHLRGEHVTEKRVSHACIRPLFANLVTITIITT